MRSREHRELAQGLAGFPAFAGCRADDLAALARAGQVTSVPAHWTFVHEGTPADACYVLLEGRAQVCVSGEERAVLEPGAVTGEMGLLSRSLRSASIVSATPVRVLRVDYPQLADLLAARPRLHDSLRAVYGAHREPDAAASDALPATP